MSHNQLLPNLQCRLCFKTLTQNITSSSSKSAIITKKSQIEFLKQSIASQKHQFDQIVQKIQSLTPQYHSDLTNFQVQNRKQKSSHSNINKTFNQKIDSIQKKQINLIKAKLLKQKIKLKKAEIQHYKKEHNQKLTNLNLLKKVISNIKTQIYNKQETQSQKLFKQTETKKIILRNLSKTVGRYFEQVVLKDFSIFLKIQKNLINYEKRESLRIKKVDELEFSSNPRQEDWMTQSIFELDNIEQVFMKQKMSQKTVHVLTQNIIILLILKKLCNFWLPYPIDCQMNFNQSKLLSKGSEISICHVKIIDYAQSIKLSNNIIQIFPQQLKKTYSNNSTDHKIEPQDCPFKNYETFDYYQRKYQLNKGFLNCLQLNAQFLSIKYGIEKRPLIFLEDDLMKRIVKYYQSSNLENLKPGSQDYSINVYEKGYNSMLKELKVSKMLQLLEKRECKGQKIDRIVEQELQNEDECLESVERSQNGESESSWNWFSIKQSVYEIIVPESLQNVKSNDTENDEFQLLTL